MAATQEMPPIANLAGQMVDGAMRSGTAGLMLLLAEMQALSAVLPGLPDTSEAGRRAHEAEVEDNFDNMPV